MSVPLLHRQAKVRQGAYLPHWTTEGAIYHLVIRLSDSLPAPVVARFRAERKILQNSMIQDNVSPAAVEARIRRLFSERIESLLDQGLGACLLARNEVAALAAEALQHFNGTRYTLHAWCIMPNHMHVIVQPWSGYELPPILKSWKGFIGRETNRVLSRMGEFWQPEYYDHLIRSEAELIQTVRYVQANPSQAGLYEWRWVWPPVA